MSDLGYLYVIEFANGTIKIGRSGDVTSRVSTHTQVALAHGNPVERVWVSDAHEDAEASETCLKRALGAAAFGYEWYTGLKFSDVVSVASQFVVLSTDAELYHRDLVSAQRMIEAHTGRPVSIHQESLPNDVLKFFALEEFSYVMSSEAFQHYLQSGGILPQRDFLRALEEVGVVKRRYNNGSRLYGIAIRTLT